MSPLQSYHQLLNMHLSHVRLSEVLQKCPRKETQLSSPAVLIKLFSVYGLTLFETSFTRNEAKSTRTRSRSTSHIIWSHVFFAAYYPHLLLMRPIVM